MSHTTDPATGPVTARKKPVEVEFMLFKGGPESASQIIDWVLGGGGTARYHDHQPAVDDNDQGAPEVPEHIALDTPEGTMSVLPGDRVIRGVVGEFYPCKPDAFAAGFEEPPVLDGVPDSEVRLSADGLVAQTFPGAFRAGETRLWLCMTAPHGVMTASLLDESDVAEWRVIWKPDQAE